MQAAVKILSVTLLVFFLACTNNGYPPAEDALDASRQFIDACLKGNFKKAGYYMMQDDENLKQLNKIQHDYQLKSSDQKYGYANASIIINEDAAISDTLHIINYQNSYDKVNRKVKAVYRNDKWLIDFKYTFNGNL